MVHSHTMRNPPACADGVWPAQLLHDIRAYNQAFGGGSQPAVSENDQIRKELFEGKRAMLSSCRAFRR